VEEGYCDPVHSVSYGHLSFCLSPGVCGTKERILFLSLFLEFSRSENIGNKGLVWKISRAFPGAGNKELGQYGG
jgi:hypothetical protein